MIIKTAANYNDEGGYIEAWKNSDGTTEVKLIPKSGGDGGKNGIKSITITPAITTTPELDSLFPIYYDDLTDGEKAEGKKTLLVNTNNMIEGNTYTAQVTATSDWYVLGDGGLSEQGGNATRTGEATQMGDDIAVRFDFSAGAGFEDESAEHFELVIGIINTSQ